MNRRILETSHCRASAATCPDLPRFPHRGSEIGVVNCRAHQPRTLNPETPSLWRTPTFSGLADSGEIREGSRNKRRNAVGQNHVKTFFVRVRAAESAFTRRPQRGASGPG